MKFNAIPRIKKSVPRSYGQTMLGKKILLPVPRGRYWVIVHGQAHKRNEEKKIKQRDDEKTGHLN